MPLGILNPGDNPSSTVTRPPHTNTEAGIRKWWSDTDEGTLLLPQDLNGVIAQVRELGDYYGITDVEGDDTYVRRAVQAALAGFAAWNFLENATFDVAQRPSPWPIALGNTVYRIADRWAARRTTAAGNATFSRQSGFNGAQYCLRLQRDPGTADTGRIDVFQQAPTPAAFGLAGKSAVLSFDLRTGANYSATTSLSAVLATGTGITEVFNGVAFPTGPGSASFAGGPVLTGGMTGRVAFLPLAVPVNATELAFRIGWNPVGTAGAADYIDITNVQLEIGPTPTAFTPRPPAVVHDLCRWYFERIGVDTALTQFGSGLAKSNVGASASYFYATKRAIPTISVVGPTNFSVVRQGGGLVDTTALVAGNIDTRSCRLEATVAAGLTAGEAIGLQGKATTNYIDISAEI